MDNAITRLIKVLELERKQGYRNKAVIGGLDKFASRWESDAFAEVPDPAAVSEIVSLLLGYAAVDDRPARERVLEAILVRARRAGESTRPASDAAETKTTAAHADTPALQDEEPAPLAQGGERPLPSPGAFGTGEGRAVQLEREQAATWRNQLLSGDKSNMPGMVRVSFGCYNNTDDVDRLIEMLKRIRRGEYAGEYRQERASGEYFPAGYEDRLEEYFMLEK